MRRILLVAICVLAFTSTVALADEASEKKAVLKMLEITNARSMTDQFMKSLAEMMNKQFTAEAADLPPEGREALEAARQETTKWLFDNFSWDQMRDMYVEIYTQVFTEAEINELVQFYQSPLGRKMLQKMPELARLSLQKSQEHVQKKMPAFQERLIKTMADIEAKYKKKDTPQESGPEHSGAQHE